MASKPALTRAAPSRRVSVSSTAAARRVGERRRRLTRVPVCVVPWGRDQLDVAAHVVAAGAGTRVGRRRLSPARLAAAVDAALACRPGAARIKAGYEATGGVATAADRLEALAQVSTQRR